jgi:hypothetical protein
MLLTTITHWMGRTDVPVAESWANSLTARVSVPMVSRFWT